MENTSHELANQLFPNERWYKFGDNCLVSKQRIIEGLRSKNQKNTLKEEISTAKIIAKNHYVMRHA